jgi:ParB-like chromosome segregation protein Spo0J
MLPVRIIPKAQADELTAIRIAIAENAPGIRQNLNPIALAKKLLALRSAGFTNRQIADAVGYETPGAVTAVIKLLELEPEVQETLIAGQLLFGHGKALLKLKGNREQQFQALHQFEGHKKEERTVSVLEHIVKAAISGEEQASLQLTLPKAVKQQELANGCHRVIIEFGTVSELLVHLTYILEHNSDLPYQYIAGNQESDNQAA